MLLGDDATYEEIATTMNLQSAGLQDLPTLTLIKFTLLRWFKKNKEVERRTVQRPLLTQERKQARLEHVRQMQDLHCERRHIFYLDEKWFYLFSKRKKSKYLPRAVFEAEGVGRVRSRRVISRQHPIKTMIMGVITQPNEEHDFSGVISLK